MRILDRESRIVIVRKILDGALKSAIDALSVAYDVPTPSFRVGTVKGHRSVAACYAEKQKTIVFANSEILRNPVVVLHEFYHHLVASITYKNGGTDKDADRFVRKFLDITSADSART